jgi:drug/metabolite transporter (DMT)-like permease
VLSKRVLARHDSLAATALLFGSAGILAAGGPELAHFEPGAVPGEVWVVGAFVVLGPTAGTYMLNYRALGRVDSSVVALFVYL